MNDTCQNICPCNQCDTEPEECELAKSFIKLQEVKQIILNAIERMDDN